MAATLKIPTIFTATDKFSSVIKTMTKNVKKWSQKSIAAVERFDQKVTKTFKKLSRIASIGLGLGVGVLLREGFNAITQFETGLVGVGKTTGIADAKLKTLGSDILKMSKQLRGVSATNLLELAQVAGQMGIKGSKNILAFTATAAKLEKATDIVGEEGTSSIARLLTITGEGVGIIDRFGASLVALGNSSAATESEILSVASEVGRATTAYKLNSQTILGISAALKSLDVAPEAAGSAILDVFRNIELATIKGGKTLRNFAKIMQLTPKQVKETFQKTPEKAFTLFIKGLNKINKEGGSVTKTMIDVGLSGKRIAKGIIPLATNFDLLEDKLNLANKAFKENKALNEEFEASTKTVNVALKAIRNSFNNLLTAEAQQGSKLELLRKILLGVADNMGAILTVAGLLITAFVAMKTILLVVRAAVIGYNIVLGIMGALSGTASIAIGASSVALGAYKIALGVATAAQWLLNIALSANPIGLIIIGIAALIAIIALVVKKYDEWGASLTFLMGPLGAVINLVMAFRRNWDMIKKAFKEGGILSGLKAIGKVLLDSVLMPLQQLLSLIAKIPGKIGRMASAGVVKIQATREALGVNTGNETQVPLQSPEVVSNNIVTENIQKGTIDLNIRDNGNNVESIDTGGELDIPISLSRTQGAF